MKEKQSSSGKTEKTRKVKSRLLAFFISRKKLQNNGRFFDQQTTVLRPSKEKPGINVWAFCVLG
ncbi:hypothetical protein, partial [Leptospira interrogans]|uniref:hypothetical protein n=1 Tax=Leptospira interrogans TaxID=173 RepID=UPI001F1AB890